MSCQSPALKESEKKKKKEKESPTTRAELNINNNNDNSSLFAFPGLPAQASLNVSYPLLDLPWRTFLSSITFTLVTHWQMRINVGYEKL